MSSAIILPNAVRHARIAASTRFHARVWLSCFLCMGLPNGLADVAAEVDLSFAASPTPLRMPTDIAVAGDGRVYIADGVNNRVVVFEADGRFSSDIRDADRIELNNPVGVSVGPNGETLIADTGNARIVIVETDGSQRVYPLTTSDRARAVDITDVALSLSGKELWVADNDHHRLFRIDRASGIVREIGKTGTSLAQFQYPFSIALTPTGDLVVSDVINARLQIFDAQGRAVRSIDRYGFHTGELYRPKGIAVDRNERIWVSDNVTNTIQIFSKIGEPLGVVRDSTGDVFELNGPMGLSFDTEGRLYVVESRANRAVRLRLIGEPTLIVERRRAPRREIGSGQQAKDCTICHADWLPRIADDVSTLLTDPAQPPNALPFASRENVCYSCHDGSVADSRKRVWLEHGHARDIAPPFDMSVPPTLPLTDGKLDCRTCHSAHGVGVPQGDIRTAIMLRMPNDNGEICISCHTNTTGIGSHPVAGLEGTRPARTNNAMHHESVDSGSCNACHTPHGSSFEALLTADPRQNDICLKCHTDVLSSSPSGSHLHPLHAILTDDQSNEIERWDGYHGENRELICLSCHQMHESPAKQFLTRVESSHEDLCIACHQDAATVVSSPHDLRTNHLGERNSLGYTAMETGSCGACHGVHQDARPRRSSPLDHDSNCITCHAPGEVGAARVLSSPNHPAEDCKACHNPHQNEFSSFLRAPPATLCVSCHKDQAGLLGGPHDASVRSTNWPDATGNDPCLSCHRPHGNATNGLYRVTPREAAVGGVCASCHVETAWGATGSLAALHPRSIAGRTSQANMTDANRKGVIESCATCHDPHNPVALSPDLLRSPANHGTALCVECHTDSASIVLTAHRPENLRDNDMNAASCKPCHIVHGDSNAVNRDLLWPAALVGTVAAEPATDDAHCTSCHRVEGVATVPRVATHPVTKMTAISLDGAFSLPLFANGKVSEHGQISCRTCHLVHGRHGIDALASNEKREPQRIAAARPQLRRFQPPNTCTTCHGADGLRRFLYFHDPQRRGNVATASPP